MRLVEGRRGGFVGRIAAGAVALGVAVLGLSPVGAATAGGPQPMVRQLAGAIPNPYAEPVAVAKVQDALFVLDGHAIDRVDLATSTFSIFAGRQFQAGSADGPRAAARFRSPHGLATDGAHLFVADTGNHTIRQVDLATGSVTTIAGMAGQPGSTDGTGAAARFDHPCGIATADGATLFVTDRANFTVRRVDVASREVHTIAGMAGHPGTADGAGPAARFTEPLGVEVDGFFLWITDRDRVRRLRLATERVATMAEVPPGEGGSRQLTGVVAAGASLYIATPTDDDEDITSAVLRMDKATGAVTPFIEPFPSPATGIASDDNDLFVAGSPVMRVDIASAAMSPAGGIAERGTADGTGAAARFSAPLGLAARGPHLYVADATPGSIRHVDVPTGVVTTLAAGILSPHGMALLGPDLFVAAGFHDVDRVSTANGAVTTFATIGSPMGSASPQDVTTDGTSLFVAHADCAIYRIALADGSVSLFAGSPGTCALADGVGTSARFGLTGCGVCGPTGITTDGTSLFVSDTYNGAIRRVAIATGEVTTFIGPGGGVFRPFGISTDGTTLYVADPIEYALRRIVVATGAVTTIGPCACAPLTYVWTPAAATLFTPSYAVVLERTGRLFFTDETGVGVLREPAPSPA
jgi:DNA-binding beta-propeller fold protein YncE